MRINGLQLLQFIAMVVCSVAIGSTANSDDASIAIWASVVVALLFVGVSICSVANAIGARETKEV